MFIGEIISQAFTLFCWAGLLVLFLDVASSLGLAFVLFRSMLNFFVAFSSKLNLQHTCLNMWMISVSICSHYLYVLVQQMDQGTSLLTNCEVSGVSENTE